ncbi:MULTISPECIES: nucleoside-diphosphate sugar epimerase/dehydratase [Euryhalocaulis]|uniref:nucleoside-diphosphate sugar epimerase/dehydratase n=1 Tax=Euryhalocaulis TaxID=1712422 RepID=UPI000399EE7E|nr:MULTISPECIES: nucleoside-diphosphate sugar epimerase/dehydratase [Euryhalocaulis]MBA4800596.1 polysaccharide biosynthesis protein [Euryhalocaulis sp.]
MIDKLIGARRHLKIGFESLAAFGALFVAHALIQPDLVLGLGATVENIYPFDLIFFAAVSAVFALLLQTHRIVWRFISIVDFGQVFLSVILSCLALVAFFAAALSDFPYRMTLLACALYMIVSIGARLVSRLMRQDSFSFSHLRRDEDDPRDRMLIMASVAEAEPFLRQMRYGPRGNRRVVGLATHDYRHLGQRIHGIEVVGSSDDLESAIKSLDRRGERPSMLVISSMVRDTDEVRGLLKTASQLKLTLARLPEIESINETQRVRVKEVALEDLLVRQPVSIDFDSVRDLVKGKRVLVTGAGGSIGAEICRQVAALGCGQLVLLDHSEYALHNILQSIREDYPGIDSLDVLCDIRDLGYLHDQFAAIQPDIVFHAAALKHVPIVERHPLEGVRTNLFGTRNVAQASISVGAEHMVLISTDKAVQPESVLGSTKRLAELYVKHLAGSSMARKTCFTTVRFGNVLGSTGSVVPHFNRQIEMGGPVTVTHPEMERYFMTIHEAVQLVLQSATLNAAREAADGIFVLEMGKPIRIIDLANQLIRLHGMEPGRDIELKISGLREGERLREALYAPSEMVEPSGVEGIICVSENGSAPRVDDAVIDRLEGLMEGGPDTTRLSSLLKDLIITPSGGSYH